MLLDISALAFFSILLDDAARLKNAPFCVGPPVFFSALQTRNQTDRRFPVFYLPSAPFYLPGYCRLLRGVPPGLVSRRLVFECLCGGNHHYSFCKPPPTFSTQPRRLFPLLLARTLAATPPFSLRLRRCTDVDCLVRSTLFLASDR